MCKNNNERGQRRHMKFIEKYHKQSEKKKVLFILSTILFNVSAIALLVTGIIYHFSFWQWLILLFLFLYIFGWLHIFFEVKKTPEEKLKEREEFIEAYVAYLEKNKEKK